MALDDEFILKNLPRFVWDKRYIDGRSGKTMTHDKCQKILSVIGFSTVAVVVALLIQTAVF